MALNKKNSTITTIAQNERQKVGYFIKEPTAQSIEMSHVIAHSGFQTVENV
jgi:hypothetical protein